MDIHKPHAAKTWREFFVELGTIIAGILIALALQEIVETSHDRARASEARRNVRAEIGENLGLINVRAATEPCVTSRLYEVDQLIGAAAGGHPGQGPIWIGRPALYALADSRYRSAAQAGQLSLLPAEEQAGYAGIFSVFAVYVGVEETEQKAWGDLRILEQHPAWSPVTDWAARSAMQQARTARWMEEAAAHSAAIGASRMGIAPLPHRRFALQSVCIPLHTPRETALALVAKGRGNIRFDEP